LAITTSNSFSGAAFINVTESWTNADGSAGTAIVADNVEAYAPGSPIFAVSGDDNLTGSSGADEFVFAQPIGNDRVFSFDTTADRIDVIGFTGIAGFGDFQPGLADDAAGNAVVTLGAGQSITLVGVDAAALTASNFAFDAEPVTVNSGTMTIGDGAILPLGGMIDNTGTIALASTDAETDLEILVHGVTLQGGGQVTLSDSQNVIFGGDTSAVLTNLDNTIAGAGQLGAGALTLVNSGTILANQSNALVIDTGSNVVSNSGTLEATGSGGLSVAGAVANTGTLCGRMAATSRSVARSPAAARRRSMARRCSNSPQPRARTRPSTWAPPARSSSTSRRASPARSRASPPGISSISRMSALVPARR
jgi:hypothetical protein